MINLSNSFNHSLIFQKVKVDMPHFAYLSFSAQFQKFAPLSFDRHRRNINLSPPDPLPVVISCSLPIVMIEAGT